MEQKKLDLQFDHRICILIFGILIWIMYQQSTPTEKEIAAEKAKKEQAGNCQKHPAEAVSQTSSGSYVKARYDSKRFAKNNWQALKVLTLGTFAYSATLPSAKENFTVRLKINWSALKSPTKAVTLWKPLLKEIQDTFQKRFGRIGVELIKDNNSPI